LENAYINNMGSFCKFNFHLDRLASRCHPVVLFDGQTSCLTTYGIPNCIFDVHSAFSFSSGMLVGHFGGVCFGGCRMAREAFASTEIRYGLISLDFGCQRETGTGSP
jgi:hypothetical protein